MKPLNECMTIEEILAELRHNNDASILQALKRAFYLGHLEGTRKAADCIDAYGDTSSTHELCAVVRALKPEDVVGE